MTSASTTEFNHAQLHKLKGVQIDDGSITQFRAIQFATIPGRFRQSALLETLPKEDFTQWGPAAPQPLPDAPPPSGIGKPVDPPNTIVSEFECLNLTITLPTSALSKTSQQDEKLPVLVWVHGGAYRVGYGANSEPQNAKRLVKLSLEIGKPVIVVALQYRLNVFGFLGGKQIQEFNRKHNEPYGNFALHDLFVGFEWVHKFIPGFGGDANKITAFGQSAGAIAIAQLAVSNGSSERKLFRQAILQSGFASLLGPFTPVEAQTEFDKIVRLFVGENIPDDEKLDKLLALPADAFADSNLPPALNRLPSTSQPVVDGDLFDQVITVDRAINLIHSQDWLDSFIAGDCKNEGFAFGGVITNAADQAGFLKLRVAESFSTENADHFEAIAKAFGVSSLITSPVVDKESVEELKSLVYLYGSVMFNAQSYASVRDPNNVLQGKPKKGYLYHFDKENPFQEAVFAGVSHHGIDHVYLFGNFLEKIKQLPNVKDDPVVLNREITVTKSIATKWIEYSYGIEPWPIEKVGVLSESGDGNWEIISDDEDKIKHGRFIDAWLTLTSTPTSKN
ncbi:Alpha/Beta hydrolase protein [Lipomyces japonicus]|uniref:Alpha/Beta hydrolase protein n=1 Tax=Lipomyces japonicus TaxID=56871 RepID=UPI0034CEF9C4